MAVCSHSDAYHSCYVLSGLSSAQHKWELVALDGQARAAAATTTKDDAEEQVEEKEKIEAKSDENANAAAGAAGAVADASWSVSPYLDEAQVFDEQDRIVPLHPVYAIPAECVADIKAYFGSKQGF